jgi:hypothetical protein
MCQICLCVRLTRHYSVQVSSDIEKPLSESAISDSGLFIVSEIYRHKTILFLYIVIEEEFVRMRP